MTDRDFSYFIRAGMEAELVETLSVPYEKNLSTRTLYALLNSNLTTTAKVKSANLGMVRNMGVKSADFIRKRLVDRRTHLAQDIRHLVHEFPDFPKPGILFKDFTPLYHDPVQWKQVYTHLANTWRGRLGAVAGPESRGFLLGICMATHLEVPFIPIRKANKLPGTVFAESYNLEYGSAILELRPELVPQRAPVLIVDDVLATGGTAKACQRLIRRAGAQVVGATFLLEIVDLMGRAGLVGHIDALFQE